MNLTKLLISLTPRNSLSIMPTDLFTIITFTLILGLVIILFNYKVDNTEGYKNLGLSPEKYGDNSIGPLLKKSYRIKSPFGLSDMTSETVNEYGIDREVSNYAQGSNNVRHWPSPDNGSCMPAGFCGSLYVKGAPQEEIEYIPPEWGSGKTRIGLYESCN